MTQTKQKLKVELEQFMFYLENEDALTSPSRSYCLICKYIDRK